jgi:hypothetical protein
MIIRDRQKASAIIGKVSAGLSNVSDDLFKNENDIQNLSFVKEITNNYTGLRRTLSKMKSLDPWVNAYPTRKLIYNKLK